MYNYILTTKGYINIKDHNNWRFRVFGNDGWRNIIIKNKLDNVIEIELYNGIICHLNPNYYVLNDELEKIQIKNLKTSMRIYKHFTDEYMQSINFELVKKLVNLIDNYGEEYVKKFEARYIKIKQPIEQYEYLYNMVMELKSSGFNLDIHNICSTKRFLVNGNIQEEVTNFLEIIVKSNDLNKLFIDLGYKLNNLIYDIENNIDCEEPEFYIIKKINKIKSSYLDCNDIHNINGIVIFNS